MTLSKPSTKDPLPSPDDPLCTVEDRLYVSRALDLARYATENGGEPFGALLFCEGEVIAEYANRVRSTGDITKHAECGLISAFSPKIDRDKFLKCTLYTSTEPCAMCCGAIYCAGKSRIKGQTTSQSGAHPQRLSFGAGAICPPNAEWDNSRRISAS